MQTKKHWAVAGIGVMVAIGAFFLWSYQAKAPVLPENATETASSTETVASSKPDAGIPSIAPATLTVNPSETIVSWDFKGAYTGNAELTVKANTEIARLAALLGTDAYPDYTLL